MNLHPLLSGALHQISVGRRGTDRTGTVAGARPVGPLGTRGNRGDIPCDGDRDTCHQSRPPSCLARVPRHRRALDAGVAVMCEVGCTEREKHAHRRHN